MNTAEDVRRRLERVLAEQAFPAARWELIAGADAYGADVRSKAELHALPPARFRSLADVLRAVHHARRIDR